MTQRKASKDHEGTLIQHSCGVPEPTEASLSKGIDKGFNAFFARNGRKTPHVSNCEISALSIDALEMIANY